MAEYRFFPQKNGPLEAKFDSPYNMAVFFMEQKRSPVFPKYGPLEAKKKKKLASI